MYIAIDIIVTVIVAAAIIGATKRGFVYSVFKLGTTIAAIVIATVFYKELAAFFSEAFVLPKVADSISTLIGNVIPEMSFATDLSQITAAIPEGLKETASLVGINIEEIVGSLGIADPSAATDAISDSLSASVAVALSNVLAFAALFFGSLIVLGIAGKLLDKLADLPVLKTANRFLGFVLGTLEGLVLGVVISKVAAALCTAYGAFNPDFAFTDVAGSTYVAEFFIDICPW